MAHLSGCFRHRLFYVLLLSYSIGCLIFSRRRRNETEKFTVNFLLNDVWPFWRKNVDDENSHSNGLNVCKEIGEKVM